MKKGMALIALLVAAALMLSGCNLIGYDAELDAAQVVAKVNDREITKAQWLAYRDYLVEMDQQYYVQYFGYSMPMTDEDIAAYGEPALQQMIEGYVLEDKLVELGFEPLSEELNAEAEENADSMYNFYKMMMRYQNYPDVETVEEEAERLAAATPDEASPVEAVATMTNEELDAKLVADLDALGMTREYMVEQEKASKQDELIREYAAKDVTVSDEEVKAEFDAQAEQQKATYDANPASYATAVNSGATPYYTPAGYRGVKHVLISLTDEDQTKIDELQTALNTAKNAANDAQSQLDDLNAADVSEYTEEQVTEHNEQVAALTEQVETQNAAAETAQADLDAATEAAFAAILPTAQEVVAKAQAGEDFDALIETYGEDPGMTQEPNKSRGYLVCDGLAIYDQAFQDAAMALESVGDVSAEPVKSSFGYHIMMYATDVESGVVEFTDDIKTTLHDSLLTEAKDAAYEAAVTQWVSEAEVKTFPKVME